jgi:hypothetical protein
MFNKLTSLVLGAALGSLAVPACNLDIPDLNNPGLEQLENNPTAAGVSAAATGMLVSIRGNKSTAVGYVNQLGILGRESYDFDANDARFVSEDIVGNLQKASPFGGSFWNGSFANIRAGSIILHALDKLASFSDPTAATENKSATKGYVETMQAWDFFFLVMTHYDTGAPVDVDRDLTMPLGPMVSKADVVKHINDLLDQGQTDLKAGGDAFPFPLSGFDGFDTPATFLEVNRALRARAAVYTVDHSKADYATALTALSDLVAAAPAKTTPLLNLAPAKVDDLQAGVFFTYSTNPGDTTNTLFSRKSVFAHPQLQDQAQTQADGTTLDQRYLDKVKTTVDAMGKPKTTTSTNDPTLTTQTTFQIYTAADASVPAIRNEELILLKAEAEWFATGAAGNKTDALALLNKVRDLSGKLPPIAMPADDNAFITALLYERQYSLMYEGGWRWIDLRRFAKPLLSPAPVTTRFMYKAETTSHAQNIRFPVRQDECDARPGEPACNITSTDPIKN